MINVYLKYSGTILVLSGIMLHNLNIFPLNIIIHLLGVVAWSLYGLNIKDKADLLKSLNQTFPSCKDISFTLYGISLAGLNFLSSLLILIYSVRTLVYEKN